MRLNKFVREVDANHDEAVLADGPKGEWNVCGVLVHARPTMLAQVKQALAAKPGVEIHHAEEDGRMIVTIEDVPEQWAGATLTSFYDVDGVINASLVFHQREFNENSTTSGDRI